MSAVALAEQEPVSDYFAKLMLMPPPPPPPGFEYPAPRPLGEGMPPPPPPPTCNSLRDPSIPDPQTVAEAAAFIRKYNLYEPDEEHRPARSCRRARRSDRSRREALSESPWLTYVQAAEYTGWSVEYLRNLVSAGQIPAYGPLGSRRFHREMLDLFLKDRDAAMRKFALELKHER